MHRMKENRMCAFLGGNNNVKNIESKIQKACVMWFRAQYRDIEPLFFAVPNGGARNPWTAKIMRDEGVRAGVADLILLVPRHGYHALAVEMKAPKGVQHDSQKTFERLCGENGTLYRVCRSFDEFRKLVETYLNCESWPKDL